MRRTGLIIVALVASAFCLSPSVRAQDEGPSFDKGPVWQITHVKTKDGHFDDYMKWLSTDWKAQEEALKKAGRIIDYKVYVVNEPRADEPDIILIDIVKNMAEFDRSTTDEYNFSKQLFGSRTKENKEQADRGSIRTLMGQTTLREVTLK